MRDAIVLRRSFIAHLRFDREPARWGGSFYDPYGSVRGNKGLVGDTPDIRFAHFVQILHLVEEFSPVAIAD